MRSDTLPVGQVPLAGAKDVADPIQRVTPSAATAVNVMPHWAPDLVDDLCGELDDMARAQVRDLYPGAEVLAPLGDSRYVGPPGAPRHEVQQVCSRPALDVCSDAPVCSWLT